MNTEEASSAANNKTQGVDPPLNVVNNEILSTDGLTTIANNEIPGVEGLATSGQGDIPLSGHEAAPGTGSWLSFFFKSFFFLINVLPTAQGHLKVTHTLTVVSNSKWMTASNILTCTCMDLSIYTVYTRMAVCTVWVQQGDEKCYQNHKHMYDYIYYTSDPL